MFSENDYGIILLIGDDSKVDTPLPIPNREVKHFYGENSVSEDSKLPIFYCKKIVSYSLTILFLTKNVLISSTFLISLS